MSKVLPGIGNQGDLIFGSPLALRTFEAILLPGVPVENILLHPVARAAWVGLLATALNLLPIGQLDGGHTRLPVDRCEVSVISLRGEA